MKALFSTIWKKLLKSFNPEENNLSQLKKFCVQAALMSWDEKANMQSCTIAAKATGLLTCDNTDIASVVKITPQIQTFIEQKNKRTRKINLNISLINCEFITSAEMLQKIDDYVKCSKYHTHLCLKNYNNAYLSSINFLWSRSINDCNFFGSVTCFMML